jgi:hypothetical protein
MDAVPTDIRLLQLQAKHQVVAADLAAMVAQAAKQRLATQALQAETAALLEELRQQCDRVSELHRAWSERGTRAT